MAYDYPGPLRPIKCDNLDDSSTVHQLPDGQVVILDSSSTVASVFAFNGEEYLVTSNCWLLHQVYKLRDGYPETTSLPKSYGHFEDGQFTEVVYLYEARTVIGLSLFLESRIRGRFHEQFLKWELPETWNPQDAVKLFADYRGDYFNVITGDDEPKHLVLESIEPTLEKLQLIFKDVQKDILYQKSINWAEPWNINKAGIFLTGVTKWPIPNGTWSTCGNATTYVDIKLDSASPQAEEVRTITTADGYEVVIIDTGNPDSETAHKCSKKDIAGQQCGASFLDLDQLHDHEQRHLGQFPCLFDNCYSCFEERRDWQRHESDRHIQQESWLCWDCHGLPEVFTKQIEFEAHLRSRHDVPDDAMGFRVRDCKLALKWFGSFWCGFCKKIHQSKAEFGEPMRLERNQHIVGHLIEIERNQLGHPTQHWVELTGPGRGKTKYEASQIVERDLEGAKVVRPY